MKSLQKLALSRLAHYQDKRGRGGMAGGISFALVAIMVVVLVVLMITSVAPTIFANSSTITGAPSFFTVMYPLMIAFSLLIVMIVIIMMMLKRVR